MEHLCWADWPQYSPGPLTFFFFSEGFWWGWEGRLKSEMRCLNTPLPSSLHPTPPHTWDGHFISESSKWKGDLNLPCFPWTPFLSASPTHRASYCWWTAHCRVPKNTAGALNPVAGYRICTGLELWKTFSFQTHCLCLCSSLFLVRPP